MSFGEQVVNAVQVHADVFQGNCHIVTLLAKKLTMAADSSPASANMVIVK